jgi:hypothetical protein
MYLISNTTTAAPQCKYKYLKTLHPGGIRTQDLLFCRQTRWPLCHAARAPKQTYVGTYGTYMTDQSQNLYQCLGRRPNIWVHCCIVDETLFCSSGMRKVEKDFRPQPRDVCRRNSESAFANGLEQGSMLWSQFLAIFDTFRRKNWRFSQKPMLWSKGFAEFFSKNILKIITSVPDVLVLRNFCRKNLAKVDVFRSYIGTASFCKKCTKTMSILCWKGTSFLTKIPPYVFPDGIRYHDPGGNDTTGLH